MKHTKILLNSEQDYVDFLLKSLNNDLDKIEHLYGIEFSYGGKFYSDLIMDDDYEPAEDDRYYLDPDKTYKKLDGYKFPNKYPCLIQSEHATYFDGTDLGFVGFNGFFYESDFCNEEHKYDSKTTP